MWIASKEASKDKNEGEDISNYSEIASDDHRKFQWINTPSTSSFYCKNIIFMFLHSSKNRYLA